MKMLICTIQEKKHKHDHQPQWHLWCSSSMVLISLSIWVNQVVASREKSLCKGTSPFLRDGALFSSSDNAKRVALSLDVFSSWWRPCCTDTFSFTTALCLSFGYVKWIPEYTIKQNSHGTARKARSAFPRACALGMSTSGSPDTVLVPLKPKILSDISPTKGVANAATAPSKHLSNEYTRFLCEGGTISAKMGLFAQGAGQAVSTLKRNITNPYNTMLEAECDSGNVCSRMTHNNQYRSTMTNLEQQQSTIVLTVHGTLDNLP